MTMTEMQSRYFELTRARADRRWKESTLAQKIAEIEEQHRKAAEREAAAEAEQRRLRMEREARVEARGPFEEFAKTYRRSEDGAEARLARAVGWALRVLEEHEKMTAKLAEEFAKNPLHTMSWGMTYVSHAADYRAALGLKEMFEAGATVEGMLSATMREMRHKASYPARSTNPMSNLCEQEELRATTKLVGYLDGSEYF